ncbi:outer membrane protein assembly factor BamA [Afipia broomeae]|uniref:Outer membrane protein assembly factor BamA n=1 Tax=Afipia broomeae ATCC 49717 TaxID=883078 RepID=K8PIH5_9BRAD|nr:outer membrane protein assembly factor BamA [Afipia broomeae]EKS38173.1 outer membrane protein assembly complex, YaeT protein [Afipia broomeae ATCC 49717]
MMVGLRVLRGGLTAALIMFALPVAAVATASLVSSQAVAQTAASIGVEGNRRIEADTIRSYFKPGPSGRLDSARIDDGLKALIETGLFQDVKINQAGGRLVVVVVENPVIGRVAFEGNKKVKDDQLSAEVQSKARGTLSRAMVQSDTARITEIYRRNGRYDVKVEPKIIEQPNNRVDLVFEITEGAKTGVKSIEFIGNQAYSGYRLRDVIKTRESNFLSFLGGNDVYDPDRIEADRDILRRFYLKNGYADVQIVAALTEYDPERKGFLVTFKIEEGQQYRVGSVEFQSSIATLDGNSFRSLSRVNVGSIYNAEAVEKSVEEMSIEASRRGYAFATVKPRGDRNFEAHTVSIVFAIEEGPRVYIERINVRGNTRTRDYVIRREFDISEGDAYNRALVDRAERRLKNLDYFKTVKVNSEPGSSSDRVVLNVDLEEKSTGDFSVSGGYSTADGFLGEVSISERNLLGRGLYAKASVQYGQRTQGYTLSFVEPYLLGYRVALGLDFYQRKQLASNYVSYDSKTIGFSPRLGFQLREDLNLQLRYSISRQEITLPYYLQNCNNFGSGIPGSSYFPTPAYLNAGGDTNNQNPGGTAYSSAIGGNNCLVDGEASVAVKQGLAKGPVITSAVGYTLAYNTLDNNKDPTSGILATLNQDFAGVGGDVSYLKTTGDVKLYTPVVADIVGVLRLQGGVLNDTGKGIRMLDHFQMGPNLVRGFAPVGIGPRDISNFATTGYGDALGGTKYWGASAELQMPFWFLPKEVGLKGAIYADAGSVFGYEGVRSIVQGASCNQSALLNAQYQCLQVGADNGLIRTSVGVGLIWQSPFGPLRFDYAIPLSKSQYDRTQEFRFGGGTSF